MLVKGDKIKLVRPMGVFTNVGEVCEVISNVDGVINFKFGNGMHMGCMSIDEFENYFEKYVEPINTFNKGDYVRMVKAEAWLAPMEFGNEYIIQEIQYGVATLCSLENEKLYYVSVTALEKNFEKFIPNSNGSDDEECDYVSDIMNNSEYTAFKVFDKCTVVACKLPNGFVIVDYSACVDPDDYDGNVAIKNCLDRIEHKVREMEAYKCCDEDIDWGDDDDDYIEEDEVNCDNCEMRDSCPDYTDNN